jgi:hypothetical protein
MTGRVSRLQSPLVLAIAVILGFHVRGTRDHISLLQIRDSPNLEGQLSSQALGSLLIASYDSQGYGWGIWTLHTGPDGPRYIAASRTAQKTSSPTISSIVACVSVAADACSSSSYLAEDDFFLALLFRPFSWHVTILLTPKTEKPNEFRRLYGALPLQLYFCFIITISIVNY